MKKALSFILVICMIFVSCVNIFALNTKEKSDLTKEPYDIKSICDVNKELIKKLDEIQASNKKLEKEIKDLKENKAQAPKDKNLNGFEKATYSILKFLGKTVASFAIFAGIIAIIGVIVKKTWYDKGKYRKIKGVPELINAVGIINDVSGAISTGVNITQEVGGAYNKAKNTVKSFLSFEKSQPETKNVNGDIEIN